MFDYVHLSEASVAGSAVQDASCVCENKFVLGRSFNSIEERQHNNGSKTGDGKAAGGELHRVRP